ncbi:LOW QUALITY PROTEIN: glutathione S-transferase zeta class-like [Solanum stenotomum]|uniref:LOW QUALITY PROTEIN: glutathione S-transferase zeta class-like n=1 Tax=Solanum stenotomum TaxID=172797 RepID=UPI0020D0842D|nr:LOW QUALITY PROTEIN: glutathione S-transferase zeta class-like [Solanum stenotomum]
MKINPPMLLQISRSYIKLVKADNFQRCFGRHFSNTETPTINSIVDASLAVPISASSMESDNSKKKATDSTWVSKIVLYSFWQSSCSWRVRFALNLKGLSYEYRAVNLGKGEQFTSEFDKLNPLHYVPVLVDGDVVISDSYAILLYLEEKYHQRPLLPVEPQLRALNLQAASIVSSNMQPLHMLSVLRYMEERVGPEEKQLWAKFHIQKGFGALEKLLTGSAGKYATGDEVYMADVFLAPQIAVATKRFNIDMSEFPTLRKYIYDSCEALPEFQASLPERQPDAPP